MVKEEKCGKLLAVGPEFTTRAPDGIPKIWKSPKFGGKTFFPNFGVRMSG